MQKNSDIEYLLSGIGWKISGYTGCQDTELPGIPFDKKTLFTKEFKNFGRLDEVSKAVCAALSCALGDAGLYPLEHPVSYPVFFTASVASLAADISYFRDFISFGETAGRANLFVYTLPTSPLGEASVHFGLTGPLLFIDSLPSSGSFSADLISDYAAVHEPDGVVLGFAEENGADADALFMIFTACSAKGRENISPDFLRGIRDFSIVQLRDFLLALSGG